MSFVDQIKNANKARKFQSDLQKQLEQIFAEVSKQGNVVVVRGDRRIERIEIDGEDRKDLKDLINDAFKEVSKKAEKQMRGQTGDLMKGFGL